MTHMDGVSNQWKDAEIGKNAKSLVNYDLKSQHKPGHETITAVKPFGLKESLALMEEEQQQKAYKTIRLLGIVLSDFDYIIKHNGNKSLAEAASKFNTYSREYHKHEVKVSQAIETWVRHRNNLLIIIRNFPYAEIIGQLDSHRELEDLGKTLRYYGEVERVGGSFLAKEYSGKKEWLQLGDIINSIISHNRLYLTKKGFVIENPPSSYRNEIKGVQLIALSRENITEEDTGLVSVISKQIRDTSISAKNGIAVPSSLDTENVSLRRKFFRKVPPHGIIFLGGISFALMPAFISLPVAISVPIIFAGVLSTLGVTSEKFMNKISGEKYIEKSKTVKGEVLSTTTISQNKEITVSSSIQELHNLIKNSKRTCSSSVYQRIVELGKIIEKLHQGESTDPESRAILDLIIEQKFRSSLDLYAQAYDLAPHEEGKYKVENIFLQQLDGIEQEIIRLQTAIFNEKVEQMQVQLLYLAPSQPGDNTLSLAHSSQVVNQDSE